MKYRCQSLLPTEESVSAASGIVGCNCDEKMGPIVARKKYRSVKSYWNSDDDFLYERLYTLINACYMYIYIYVCLVVSNHFIFQTR